MAFDFLKRICKPKTTDVLFDKVVSTGKARLENQDGCISEFGHSEIKEYIQKIIDDTQQFLTLELAEVNYGVRYVQASVNYGKISVQLGLEEGDNTKLVEKVCSQEECQRIFLEFFDYGYVNAVEEYKPVQFLVQPHTSKDRLNRDEMFYRIAHINMGLEKKEDVLTDLRKVTNPNFQDSQGTSYLHMACQAHSVEAVSILLELGADANICDKRGCSPILSALGSINENNNIIFELMLKHGLDLERMEGDATLKEKIRLFDDEGFNRLIEKFSRE